MLNHAHTLTGFKRYAAAFGLGAGMSLAMPPVGAFPLLLLCVPGFIILTRAAETKTRAFLVAWSFGAGYFICGLYWISAALFVDIGLWGWVLPFSLILGPAIFALFYGFIPLLAWRFRGTPLAHTLALVAAWGGIEWLRGHLLTGFPWNLTGYTWMHVLPVMQTSAYVGIYGLSLLTLLWAAIPVLPRGRLQKAIGLSFIALCLLGAARLYLTPPRPSAHTVRVVQANIGVREKWSRENEVLNLQKQAVLSQSLTPVSFVVWPETAVTVDLSLSPDVASFIGAHLPRGAIGIIGASRFTEEKDGTRRFYNNAAVLNDRGEVIANYDKHHLVPFGEYIPFRNVLNLTPLSSAMSNMGEFSRGDGPATLAIGTLPPFSPLVCYEVIFPRAVVPLKDRPDWMVNVTNDSWYGRTAGPYQHFEIARIRAVEEGLPLVRAASTGISAVIDPLGRVLARQPLGTEGAIETALPSPLPPTLYARFGDIPFLMLLGLLILGAGLPISSHRHPRESGDPVQNQQSTRSRPPPSRG